MLACSSELPVEVLPLGIRQVQGNVPVRLKTAKRKKRVELGAASAPQDLVVLGPRLAYVTRERLTETAAPAPGPPADLPFVP